MIRGLRPQQSGFTIIETIIVLTVSIGLVAGAVAVFNTRIPKTQFNQGVFEFESKLRSITSNVTNGYYPNPGNLRCVGGTVEASGVGTTPSEQGTSQDCIFLGNAIQFAPAKGGCQIGSVTNIEDCDSFNVYVVTGKRVQSDGSTSKTISEASPNIVDTSISAPETYKTAFGLHITKILPDSSDFNGVVYTQSFGSATAVGTSSTPTGASQLEYTAVAGYKIGQPIEGDSGFVKIFNTSTSTIFGARNTQPITICFKGGYENQYATITLGEFNNPSSIRSQIYNTQSDWSAKGC